MYRLSAKVGTRGSIMDTAPGRRVALTMMGLGIAAGAAGLAALHGGVASAAEASLLPPGAKSLEDLTARLSKTPRRRDFKTVPMILNDPDQWDHAALSAVIAYRGAPKQVRDNTEISSPWLNLMRNALNPDDEKTDPAGNSGARGACGVIEH